VWLSQGFQRLLGRFAQSRPALPPNLEARLEAFTERSPPATRYPHRRSRYVTVDLETTGTDMHRDRVLSIGAVTIEHGLIDLAQCFEVVIRQESASSSNNILIHRIGGQRQLGGVDRREALLSFLEFLDHAPLVAYRAEFDRTVLDRSLQEDLGLHTMKRWIDLAEVLTALFPGRENRSLDEWLSSLEIPTFGRHDALADAFATAQLLQVCLPKAEAMEIRCPQELIEMATAQRWLGKR